MRVTAIEYGHAFVRVNRARQICRATSPRYFGKLSFPRRVDNRNVAAPIFVAIASVPRMGVDFCTRFDNTSVERLYLRLTAFQFSFTIFFFETVFSSSFFATRLSRQKQLGFLLTLFKQAWIRTRICLYLSVGVTIAARPIDPTIKA